MNSSEQLDSRNLLEALAHALLWCLWQAIRLLLLGFLMILAPVVRILLAGFALLGTLTALLYEFAGTRPFPFFGMLAVSLGAFGVLVLYECIIELLVGRRRD